MIDWLENHMLPCLYKQLTGNDCPGCGMQRSVIALLQGDFQLSFTLYPALLPILIMLTFLAIHVKFRLRSGAQILQWMFVINVLIILASYLFKQFFLDAGGCEMP